MLTTDELNMNMALALESEGSTDIQIDKYTVRELTRADVTRIMAATAPFFSRQDPAEPAKLLEVMHDADFEDTIIAAALQLDLEEVQAMSYQNIYYPIVQAFNDLNPNFISDIAQSQAARTYMYYALAHK